MTIGFPTTLDNFTNPTPADNLNTPTVLHSTQHANLNDVVEALEAKVGVNGSLVTASLDYKVTQLEASTHAAVTIGTANGLTLNGQQLSLGVASGAAAGALSAADWTTFNSKQAALTFPLAANLGGTGVANAAGSTLTLGAATTISGGGTIALGGYTLTVPATLTVAGLGIANVYTTNQKINCNSTVALHVEQDGVKDDVFIVDTANGRVAVNTPFTSFTSGVDFHVKSLLQIGVSDTFKATYGPNSIVFYRNGTNYFDALTPGNYVWRTGNPLTARLSITAAGLVSFGNITPLVRVHIGEVTTTTNAVVEALRIQSDVSTTSTGGANGFGVGQSFYAETGTDGTDQQQAYIYTTWVDATNASRKARLVLSAYDTAEREGIRVEASGTAPLIGFLGAAAVARQAHIVDADGNLADVTSKFNTLLSYLENFGLIATS